jgi:hypothetical protein
MKDINKLINHLEEVLFSINLGFAEKYPGTPLEYNALRAMGASEKTLYAYLKKNPQLYDGTFFTESELLSILAKVKGEK